MRTHRITRALAVSVCVAMGLAIAPAAATATTTSVRGAAAGPAATFSPTTVTFPDTFAEDDSAAKTLTLTSSGSSDLVITGAVQFFEADGELPGVEVDPSRVLEGVKEHEEPAG